jgi:hypothetical protein
VNFSLKDKFLTGPLVGETLRRHLIFLIFLPAAATFGQVEKQVSTPKGDLPSQKPITRPDSVLTQTDTLKTKPDSLASKRKSDIETTITYSARDSINSNLNSKIVHLYGDSKIQYGLIQLMAEDITIDYEQSTISAQGRLDTLGRRIGYPIFINGNEKYETKNIVYNFKTKKARISEVVTKQGDGFLHGSAVFKNSKNELLSIQNAYTTCNLAHPHYKIIASKAKAIPNDKMVLGPFHMEITDVPLPLGFAFGIFPSPKKSASGVIVPSYGEERNRGFFLRNGGYFFDISDYFKLQLTGDIYSKGSSALYLNSNYRKRYAYNGTFNFSFTSNATSPNIEEKNTVKDFRITWSHTPQTKGTGRFSASVNAATASYNNNNFLPINTNPSTPRLDNTTRKLSSNISYSKTFGNLFSLGTNFRINQDLTTKQVDLTLPDVSFNVNNLYPLKKVSDGMIFQNLSMRYTMSATNQITNNLGRNFNDANGVPLTHDSIAAFNGQNFPLLMRNAKKGVRHSIPIATSFKVLKFFTVSPGVSYDELWYFEKLDWGVSADGTKPVVKDTVHEFNRVVNYSANVSMTTRIYGTYFFKNKTGIQAIRHLINPSAGLSFAPDFGDPSYGYYQKLTLANNANPVYKSVNEGFVYGSSRFGKTAALSFGINNNVEMKVKSKKDTVAKKVSLFNTLSINSSYNFVSDSFKLAPFSLAANTNVLNDKLNINATASLDPYRYVTISNGESGSKKEIKTQAYAWQSYRPATPGWDVVSGDKGIGRITNANLALSTNLNPKGQKKDTNTRDKIAKANISDSDKKYLLQNPDSYIDFNIPWNVRISYNVDYSHPVNVSPIVTQALRFNGDFSLTEKWKITYNSGYDFQKKEVTQTQITVARDLHCWLINLSWVPFGKYQSYTFYIGVKSSMLKDLRLNRTRSFFDN